METAQIVMAHTQPEVSTRFASFLQENGLRVLFADSGHKLLELLRQDPKPDLMVVDYNLQDPAINEFCHTIKSDPNLSGIPAILLVAENQVTEVSHIIESGCGDIIVQPVSPPVLLARIRFLLRLKGMSPPADDAESVLYTLTRTIEAKDSYTMGHADRVALFAMDLGAATGVNGAELEILRKGGKLHDIGKIAIPDAILMKPGKYEPAEFEVMKKHPVLGCEICGKLKSVQEALPLIRHHHEHLDGTGYPDGLTGDQIPALVRIVAIVDIYDALRSKRIYKEAFPMDETFQTMWEEAHRGWWDKDLLDRWESLVRNQQSGLITS
ncbi:MAG: HD domain-containing protein [Elusimicrobia bacterium]|nr:HD domain-containing protein [Candidatus Obscuribacterium magneticum]